MASGLLLFPGAMPITDDVGARIAGARAFIYTGVTTALATVYADAALTVELANPVVADSLGTWPLIYSDNTLSFTVALTDADGVPLSGKTWSAVSPAIDAATASVGLAQGYADQAEASAASALGAPGTSATSSTDITIGAGSKVFVLNEVGKQIGKGQRIVAASAANALNQVSGKITAFDGTNLTVNVDATGGAGSHADWEIRLTGDGAVSSVAGLTGAVPTATLKSALSLDAVQNLPVAGRQAIWIPAAAMVSRITNGAGQGLTETTTNRINRRTLDFDASTRQFAQFTLRMPKSWDEGVVTAVFEWSHAATTVNFKTAWALQGVAISDQDPGDAAFGTAQQVNDTGGVTDTMYASPESAAVTIAGTPLPEDLVVLQVYRVADDAVNDTLAINARLHGVTLYITTSAVLDT